MRWAFRSPSISQTIIIINIGLHQDFQPQLTIVVVAAAAAAIVATIVRQPTSISGRSSR